MLWKNIKCYKQALSLPLKSKYTSLKHLSHKVLTQCIAVGTPKNLYVQFSSLFKNFFPVKIDFFNFLSVGVKQTAQNFNFVDFDWENALKWFKWYVYRVQGVPNSMALVSSLYNKRFLKNQNCRRKVVLNGLKPSKWNGTYAAVLLGSHSTPTPHFGTLCLNIPLNN